MGSIIKTATPITSHLYLSGETSARDKSLLLSLKVSAVVNVTKELAFFHEADKEKRFTYHRVPITDHDSAKILHELDAATAFINSHIKSGKCVLVHCKAGVSRSPSIVLAYLIKYENLDLRQAYELVKSRRGIISPNKGFWRQLIEYELLVRKVNSVKIIVTDLGDEWPDYEKLIDDTRVVIRHNTIMGEPPPPARIRKRKQDEDQEEEGEVPDHISQYLISDVANHLVLLANSCPTTCYLLMRAVRTDAQFTHAQSQGSHAFAHAQASAFHFSFDDNFRNDDEAMIDVDVKSEYTESGIEWHENPDLVRSVSELYNAYDAHDCTWESIDFTVFVDESGENWCFKCVFSYPPSSTKKRCVVTNPPQQPDVD